MLLILKERERQEANHHMSIGKQVYMKKKAYSFFVSREILLSLRDTPYVYLYGGIFGAFLNNLLCRTLHTVVLYCHIPLLYIYHKIDRGTLRSIMRRLSASFFSYSSFYLVTLHLRRVAILRIIQ